MSLLTPDERRLVERLHAAHPAARARIDACIDRTIAARAHGKPAELVEALAQARVVDPDELRGLVDSNAEPVLSSETEPLAPPRWAPGPGGGRGPRPHRAPAARAV